MNYQEIHGDLIYLAKEGMFDVIGHGCNCFATQGAGIAKQINKEFNTLSFNMENSWYTPYERLGNMDFEHIAIDSLEKEHVTVANLYTQYKPGKNLKYAALTNCLIKMNIVFAGKHIGLPQIGCGIGGGSWKLVKKIIKTTLVDCKVTVVIYKPSRQMKLEI